MNISEHVCYVILNLIQVGAKFSGCCACCCTDEGPFLTTVDIMDDAEEDSGIFMAGSYGMLEVECWLTYNNNDLHI